MYGFNIGTMLLLQKLLLRFIVDIHSGVSQFENLANFSSSVAVAAYFKVLVAWS